MKVKVEKDYGAMLKEVAKGAKPVKKDEPVYSALDDVLKDQKDIGDALENFSKWIDVNVCFLFKM